MEILAELIVGSVYVNMAVTAIAFIIMVTGE